MLEEWKKVGAGNPLTGSALGDIPSIGDLFSAVESAKNSWEEKKGHGFHHLYDRFRSFAGNLKHYSDLASVIPNGDKYVCLIVGVVSSIIKISGNYDEAAEAFSKGLSGLTSSLSSVRQEIEIANTEEMQKCVFELYAEVFHFLCQAIDWYSNKGKRLLRSFDTKFANRIIDDSVAKVTSIEDRIRHEAERYSRAKLNKIEAGMVAMPVQFRKLEEKLASLGDSLDRLAAQKTISLQQNDDLWAIPEQVWLELLGQAVSRVLQATEQHTFYNLIQAPQNSAQNPSRTVMDNPSNLLRLTAGTSVHTDGETQATVSGDQSDSMTWTSIATMDDQLTNRYDVERIVLPLRSYLEDGREEMILTRRGMARNGLPEEAVIGLYDWTRVRKTTVRWIQGPNDDGLSGISMTAMQLCDTVLKAKIPYISYFCQRRHHTAGLKDLTSAQAGLVAMLYASIVQLVQLLPVEFRASTNLTEVQFKQLDGTFSSAKLALTILESLAEQIDGMLHWVLDGLNSIENDETRPYIAELVDILRRQGQRMICKVCSVTNGGSRVLNKSLKVNEIIDASRVFFPGRPLRGGVHATDLGIFI